MAHGSWFEMAGDDLNMIQRPTVIVPVWLLGESTDHNGLVECAASVLFDIILIDISSIPLDT